MKKHRIASTRKHADAYSELVALGVPAEDIAVHDWNSDLYVRKTPLTERWLDGYEFKDNVETFIDEIDHEPWYDVPFGNGMFFEKALTKGWWDRYSRREKPYRTRSASVSDPGFQSDIMDFLTDRLYDYEGNVFYGGDLAMELTDAENMDGGWIIGYSKALDYICEHRLVSAEVFDNFKFEFGETPNPFDDPEGFTYYMLDYGVRNLLGGSKFLDGHWDEEIELTSEVIETIIGEIDGTRAAGRRMGNRRRVR